MRKKRELLLGVCICIIIAAVLFFVIPEKKITEKNTNSSVSTEIACATDADCVKVQAGCCSCAMGGKDICVSRKAAAKYEEQLQKCGRVFCAASYACTPDICRCVQGACQ